MFKKIKSMLGIRSRQHSITTVVPSDNSVTIPAKTAATHNDTHGKSHHNMPNNANKIEIKGDKPSKTSKKSTLKANNKPLSKVKIAKKAVKAKVSTPK